MKRKKRIPVAVIYLPPTTVCGAPFPGYWFAFIPKAWRKDHLELPKSHLQVAVGCRTIPQSMSTAAGATRLEAVLKLRSQIKPLGIRNRFNTRPRPDQLGQLDPLETAYLKQAA